ncbi:hypothetical protein HDV00_008914 [Rhizophlyctis rosea]|nr:hypothetical protein HDV00_008914 [Rhizophlyctis rosea]
MSKRTRNATNNIMKTESIQRPSKKVKAGASTSSKAEAHKPGNRTGWQKQSSNKAATYYLPSNTIIDFYPSFLTAAESTSLYTTLTSAPHPPYTPSTPEPTDSSFRWCIGSYKIFGKDIPAPRLLAGFSDEDIKDVYTITPFFPWTPELREMKEKIEGKLGITVRYAQTNWYRDGKDSIGFHTDDEARDGDMIVSLSVGASRVFKLRHKKYREVGDNINDDVEGEGDSDSQHEGEAVDETSRLPIVKLTSTKIEFDLTPGSLLIMRGECQKHWKHGVPKEKNVTEGRVNITFREF